MAQTNNMVYQTAMLLCLYCRRAIISVPALAGGGVGRGGRFDAPNAGRAPPDACNMNLYRSGKDSIGWHSENETLFDVVKSHASIVSVSFCGDVWQGAEVPLHRVPSQLKE